MFIWEVFQELFECPDKKFHLFDGREEKEYVISTDYNVGVEPHYIIYECFYKGKNIASESLGGFDGNIPIHSNGWEEVNEVRYYVKFKVLDSLEILLNGEKYLNYYQNRYFIGSQEEFGSYKTSFTRGEIEEFGIEHPEVRREDLEFIEVVE